MHAAKGLEFAAVMVSALDQLPSSIDRDDVRDSNLLYVGLTRASEQHGRDLGRAEGAFTDRVLRSNKAEALADR